MWKKYLSAIAVVVFLGLCLRYGLTIYFSDDADEKKAPPIVAVPTPGPSLSNQPEPIKAETKINQIDKIFNYVSILKEQIPKMDEVSTKSFDVLDTFSETWRRAIKEGFDFNVLLRATRNTDPEKSKIESAAAELSEITKVIHELNSPPDKYKDAYMAVLDVYSTLVEIQTLSDTPRGSLMTFNKQVEDLRTAYINKKAKAVQLLP